MRSRTTSVPRSLSLAILAIAGISAAQACGDSADAAWLEESVPSPAVFAPGIISSGLREYGITFSPDAREAYFARRPRRGSPQIFLSNFEDGVWSEPSLAAFATEHDEAPRISADGEMLIFASRRLMPGSGDRSDNLWFTRRGPDGWNVPSPLRGAVNQPRTEDDDFVTGTELGPAFLPDGSLLYWSRRDPDWGADIYRSERMEDGTYGQPAPLRINSTGDETNAALSPDGRFLVFQAYRDASAPGNQDLYVSRRNEFGWDTPVSLPAPLNSPANDGYPSFSPDGRFFFFATDRSDRSGYYDIWYVDADVLDLDDLTRRP